MSVRKSFRGSLLGVLVLSMLVSTQFSAAAEPNDDPQETKEQRDRRMAWWRDARFGMFIHWGLYAVPAGEWKGNPNAGGEWIMQRQRIPVAEYAKLAEQFNPTKFDADAWVQLAKDAGMKYIVITSKHHDGFAMFETKASPFNIVDATPYGRDPMKDLAEACRKHGIKLGFYYSQAQDWHHPGGAAKNGHWDPAQDGDMTEYIRNVAVPQVREILTNYGPIAVLWWDSAIDMTKERADLLLPLQKLQPDIIVNNRLGYKYHGDTLTPEQFIPPTGYPDGRDWETCMTMNGNWGYAKHDQNWKSTETLIRNLADIASKGGNYLLNVGPTAEGVIPEPNVERLRAIGEWMKLNGESIYGTTASAFKRLPWGRCTQKPGKLYLHVFDWPQGELFVPGLKNRATKAYLLADPKRAELPVQAKDGGVAIQTPAEAPDAVDTVVVLEIEGEPDVTQLPPGQDKDGSVLLSVFEAAVDGKHAKLELVGSRGQIRLRPKWDDAVRWEFAIDRPGKFEVRATYLCDAGKDGSKFEASAAGQTLSGTVEVTGPKLPRDGLKVGEIELPKAGRYALSIKMAGGPDNSTLNLQSITLKPVRD